ncbi:MAG: hypothetical protein ACK4F9_06590 [Brevinematia bacterium]
MDLFFRYPLESILFIVNSTLSLGIFVFLVFLLSKLFLLDVDRYYLFSLIFLQFTILVFSVVAMLSFFEVIKFQDDILLSLWMASLYFLSGSLILSRFSGVYRYIFVFLFIFLFSPFVFRDKVLMIIIFIVFISVLYYLLLSVGDKKRSYEFGLALLVLSISVVLFGIFVFYGLVVVSSLFVFLISFYVLFLGLRIFADIYVLLFLSEDKAKDRIFDVAIVIDKFSSFWDKIKSYENLNKKLVFSLESDMKRFYNYFRYVGDMIDNFKEDIESMKVSFDDCFGSLSYLVSELENFLDEISRCQEKLNDFNIVLGGVYNQVQARIEFFKNLSDEILSLIQYTKGIREYFRNSTDVFIFILDKISSLIDGILFVFEVSVEGEIMSKDLAVINDSFRVIKSSSYESLEYANAFKQEIGKTINRNMSLAGKILDLEKEIYGFLSLSDYVFNSSLGVKKKLELLDSSLYFDDIMNEVKKSLGFFKDFSTILGIDKEEFFGKFYVFEEALSIVNTIGDNINNLISAVSSITSITEIVSQSLENVKVSFGKIKNDIESILV